MIDLLVLLYAAILWIVFKVFKVPINKWTATTAVLVGVLGIGWVVITMNYNHPYSREARLYFYTTPVYPRVNGRVIEVPVEPNTALAEGDILFRFDPRPFEADVVSREGELVAAEVERTCSEQCQGTQRGAAPLGGRKGHCRNPRTGPLIQVRDCSPPPLAPEQHCGERGYSGRASSGGPTAAGLFRPGP